MTKKQEIYGRKEKEVNLAVDIVIFGIVNDNLNVLLIQSKKEDLKNKWTLPGGLVEYGNSLEKQAKKVLLNKTGIKNVLLDQLATFGDPKRDPFGHVVSVVYIGLVDIDKHILETTEQYTNIEWFPITKIPKLGFDHKKIIDLAKQRLKNKIIYTNIAQGILPKEFTLSEIQKIYEIILEKEIDKRNFRKKILSLGILKELDKKKIGSSRPATLYEFSSKKIKEYL